MKLRIIYSLGVQRAKGKKFTIKEIQSKAKEKEINTGLGYSSQ
jgi:hypothetical protein